MAQIEQEICGIPSVRLDCDKSGCRNTTLIMDSAAMKQCKEFLLANGWRLYRGKTLCPYHASVVEKRLAKRRYTA